MYRWGTYCSRYYPAIVHVRLVYFPEIVITVSGAKQAPTGAYVMRALKSGALQVLSASQFVLLFARPNV